MTKVDMGLHTGKDAPSGIMIDENQEAKTWAVVGIHAGTFDALISRYESLLNEGYEQAGNIVFANALWHVIMRIKNN